MSLSVQTRGRGKMFGMRDEADCEESKRAAIKRRLYDDEEANSGEEDVNDRPQGAPFALPTTSDG